MTTPLRVPGRDETGNEFSSLPTFASEHAAARWYQELEIFVVCQNRRPTKGSVDFETWPLETARHSLRHACLNFED